MWDMGSQVEDGRVLDGCVRPAVKLQLPQEGQEDRQTVIRAPMTSFPQLLTVYDPRPFAIWPKYSASVRD